ncbi:MAG: hypothetical protein KDA96_25575, partial [Planctomycetaceae bacterium]|nr:hypothetical protein [Planctomycetaceae bacterium]
ARFTHIKAVGSEHQSKRRQRRPGQWPLGLRHGTRGLQNNDVPDQPERVRVRFLRKPGANALRLILNPKLSKPETA